MAKARGDQASSAAKPTVYRDRASERRVVHGQPDAPVPEPSSKSFANNNSNSGGGGGGSKKLYDTPVHPPAPPAPPPKEPAKDENNIGNKMLKKMGWSEGTGLGLSGEGRVDPMHVSRFTFFEYTLSRISLTDVLSYYLHAFFFVSSQTAMYASGAGLGASKGKDITKIADLDYAGLARESVSSLIVDKKDHESRSCRFHWLTLTHHFFLRQGNVMETRRFLYPMHDQIIFLVASI